MLAFLSSLRALAFLRRMARALERSAEADTVIARLMQSDYDLRHPAPRATRKKVQISTLDVAAANAAFHAERRAAGLEDDLGNPT